MEQKKVEQVQVVKCEKCGIEFNEADAKVCAQCKGPICPKCDHCACGQVMAKKEEFKGFYYYEMQSVKRTERLCLAMMVVATILLVVGLVLS